MPEPGVLPWSCSPSPSGQSTSCFSSCKTFLWAYAWRGLSLLSRWGGISTATLRAFSSKSHQLIRKKKKSYKRKKILWQDFSYLFFYLHPHSFFSFAVFSFFISQKLRKIDIFPLVPIGLQAHVAAIAICSRSWSLLRGSWMIQAFWEMQSSSRTKSRLAACPVPNEPGWVLLRTCQLPPEPLPVCRLVCKYPRPILEGGPQDFSVLQRKPR